MGPSGSDTTYCGASSLRFCSAHPSRDPRDWGPLLQSMCVSQTRGDPLSFPPCGVPAKVGRVSQRLVGLSPGPSDHNSLTGPHCNTALNPGQQVMVLWGKLRLGIVPGRVQSSMKLPAPGSLAGTPHGGEGVRSLCRDRCCLVLSRVRPPAGSAPPGRPPPTRPHTRAPSLRPAHPGLPFAGPLPSDKADPGPPPHSVPMASLPCAGVVCALWSVPLRGSRLCQGRYPRG